MQFDLVTFMFHTKTTIPEISQFLGVSPSLISKVRQNKYTLSEKHVRQLKELDPVVWDTCIKYSVIERHTTNEGTQSNDSVFSKAKVWVDITNLLEQSNLTLQEMGNMIGVQRARIYDLKRKYGIGLTIAQFVQLAEKLGPKLLLDNTYINDSSFYDWFKTVQKENLFPEIITGSINFSNPESNCTDKGKDNISSDSQNSTIDQSNQAMQLLKENNIRLENEIRVKNEIIDRLLMIIDKKVNR